MSEEAEKRTGQTGGSADIRFAAKEDLVGTERGRVQAAIAARDRDQGRLRAITVAIGAASVLAGGAVAYVLPGTATAAPSTSHSTTSQHGSGNSAGGTKGSSGTGKSSSRSGGSGSAGSSKSGSGGLQRSSAPTSSSGGGQVTSGGS